MVTIAPVYNFTVPSDQLQRGYQVTAGVFGLLDVYLFIALLAYEIFIPDKPPSGKKLRILCLLAAFTAALHGILQQFIVSYSGLSTPLCFGLMSTKSTLFNAIISFTYAFLWLRQRMFYSNPQLHKMRGKWMEVATWLVLALLIINPCVMLGFQFNGVLYLAENGTCLVMRMPWYNLLPFILVPFSYAIIQATLVFLYFYPLYKRNIPKRSPSVLAPSNGYANTITGNVLDATVEATQHQCVSSGKDLHSVCVCSKVPQKEISPSPKLPLKKKKQRGSNGRSLETRMKRWIILSFICIVSDAAAATIIAVFLLAITPASLITVIFLWHDVNMFISVLCVIGCFSDFKLMLYPFGEIFKQNY